MAKNPVLPLYYNDILGSTITWTDEEFGAYMRLLIEQWDKGFIPGEMKRLQKIADSVNKNWDAVLCQKFTPGEDGLLRNANMEKIRVEREKFLKHQSENGSKGGRPSKEFSDFKEKILKNLSKVDFDFEIGFCEKEKLEGFNVDYYDQCINFLTKLNPNKTQTKPKKKPLEEEIEIEEEKELEKEIILPFTSEFFQASWEKWKNYRKTEHRKKYRSIQSEQTALSHLENISGKDEFKAIKIIELSIANQWQGLFEIKNEINGSNKITRQQGQQAARALAIDIGKREFAAIGKANTGS